MQFFWFQKFVCTTIRPTLLSYKEIYDYDGCAQFVSDYLTFFPLDPPIDLVSLLFFMNKRRFLIYLISMFSLYNYTLCLCILDSV